MVVKEEHLLIQNTAREFATSKILPIADKNNKEKIFPKELIEEAGKLGFMGMLLPSKYGGSNVDLISYCLVLKEIAYACASTSVIISVHNMVGWAVSEFGSEFLKNKYLSEIASGRSLCCFALTEANAGSDAGNISMKAQKDGDNYLINGTKLFVTSGSNAKFIMAMARTDSSISAFLIEKNTPGIYVNKIEEKMGLTSSDTVELVFENCSVPKQNIIGEEGNGFKIAMNALNHGRIGIAAQCVGVAKACLDEAVQHSKSRKQFGRFLSEFGGVQWMIADMATEVEAANSLMLYAASLETQKKDFIKHASMAKLFASETANRVAFKALQLHGGYGYIKDYKIERLTRDARATTIYEGTSEIQKYIITRYILNESAEVWNEKL